jgi:hypothetical protein
MTSILKKIFLTQDGTFPILQILLGILIGIIGVLIYMKYFTIESDDTLELIQLSETTPLEKKADIDTEKESDQVPFIVNIDSLPNIPKISEIQELEDEIFQESKKEDVITED